MKKTIALLLTFTLALGILSGCGKANKDKTDSSSQNTESADTRSYTDLAGRTVDIPVNPERIVTVNMVSELIALGIKPVGAADGWLQYLDEEQKQGIESIGAGAAGTLNLEKIAELNPDLIITPNIERVTSPEVLASLEKIAPTIVGPWYGDALENLNLMGEITGRTEEAQKWQNNFEDHLGEVKASLEHVVKEGETAMVIQFYQKSMYTYPSSTFPAIYDYLGLSVPSKDISDLQTDASQQSFQLSLEILPEYNPDYIFITKLSDVEEGFITETYNNSVWKQLSAVKNKKVYELGSRLSAGDVLSLEWSLDEIQRLLTTD